MKTSTFNLKYVLFLATASAMGGFLFGYDWVVIGGAKPFYELFFDITNDPALQGWAMSSALVGCVFGSALSGLLADRWGRKNSLLLAAMLFILSALGTGLATVIGPFVTFRIVGGVGIGLASTLSPMYIAEIAPATYRGRFVALNQLTLVIGILSAQIVNWCIAENVPAHFVNDDIIASWNGQRAWRWMFWAELAPAFLFLGLLLGIPKSPRFLARSGNHLAAKRVLEKIGGTVYAEQELHTMQLTLQKKTGAKVSSSALGSKNIKPILVVGVVLAIFQQWCGINIIFNYAHEIFTAAGYSVGDMLFNIIITGIVNLLFTFVAIRTVDTWGRRKLMLVGSLGLALVYAFLGGAYFFEFNGLPVLALVVIAIAIYAMSLAPITWVVLSEIFPNRIRGVAMSVATFALWTASFVLTFTFPLLNDALGAYGTFWVYSGISFLGYVFIRNKLPETKGKSLEEIEMELTQRKDIDHTRPINYR